MHKKFELEIAPDTLPDLVVERGPQNTGVGRWVPDQKHALLAKYLIGTRQAWKKWPQRVFIDPFCGPGRIQVKGEMFTRDGGATLAWRQSLLCDAPFTQMLVGDLDPERSHACASRLTKLGAPVKSFSGPATDTIKQMVRHVPKNALCLAYIDPYNLEYLSFSIIQALAHLKVDFAVHFSTMDLHRNVEFEFDPTRARFDETAPRWRENIAVTQTNKASLPSAFFSYWCELVRSLGFTFSHEMPLVYNDRNHPIYRLVFFARHELPNRIWGDVAQGPNLQLNFD